MSRRQQTMRTPRLAALLGCAAALALSGCASGPSAQTAQQVAAVNGANGETGPIALRDAVLAYPGGEGAFGYRPGEDAPLRVTIANSAQTADELIAVTSPAAGGVAVQGRTTVPGGTAVTSAGSGTDTTPTAAGTPSQVRQLRIVLTDLRVPLRPGLNTPVMFRFREAGEVTLPVPIDAPVGVAPAEAGSDAGQQAGHHSG